MKQFILLLTVVLCMNVNADNIFTTPHEWPVEAYKSPLEKVVFESMRRHSAKFNIISRNGVNYRNGFGHCYVVASEQVRNSAEFGIKARIDEYELSRAGTGKKSHTVVVYEGAYAGMCSDNGMIGKMGPFPCEELERWGKRVNSNIHVLTEKQVAMN